ncbi:hypothetical protein KAU15_05690 [candidate division WOR-3 bacterium]|nr:hypothetical protein [candidate division WOR-3 bacterium]
MIDNGIISISGIDSSGKSTQIEKLREYYEGKDKRVRVIWSRGGYTGLLQFLKDAIRRINPRSLPSPGNSEKREEIFRSSKISHIWIIFSIIDLIRLYSIKLRILKILGIYTICDRYLEDTIIDFKIKFPNIDFQKWILWRFLRRTSVKPYISFVLYIAPTQSMERSIMKKEPFSESAEVRVIRHKMYSSMIKKGYWSNVINGDQSIDEIFDLIRRAIIK